MQSKWLQVKEPLVSVIADFSRNVSARPETQSLVIVDKATFRVIRSEHAAALRKCGKNLLFLVTNEHFHHSESFMTHLGKTVSIKRFQEWDMIYVIPCVEQIRNGGIGFVVTCTVIKALCDELRLVLKFFVPTGAQLGAGAEHLVRILNLES